MTREEAKNVLRLYNNQKFGIVSPEFWEAIAVAIAALQSDQETPDLSRAAGAKAGENDSVTVKLPKI